MELLVALSVSSIILAAVATLAYAFGRVRASMGDTSRTQAQVRYSMMRISDLVRYCRLVCYADDDSFAVWRADDNDDGQINAGELVYIDKGSDGNGLRLCMLSSTDSTAVSLGDIKSLGSSWWMVYRASVAYVVLMPDCSSVEFGYDVLPPQCEFVNIHCEVVENGEIRQYETSVHLRNRAANLLSGSAIVSDDD